MAFETLRKSCCGLGIHKTWIFVYVGITDPNGRIEYEQAHFSSSPNELRDLADWPAKYSCLDTCMESTGKRWVPVSDILEKTCWVTLAHPKYAEPQRDNKIDRKDAKWIYDLYVYGVVEPSFTPSPDICQFRDLIRYRVKLTGMLTGEKNRVQNYLTVSSPKPDDASSDVFGKSSRSVVQCILEHPDEQSDVILSIHRRCKHPVREIQTTVGGMVSRGQIAKLKECLLHIGQLNAHRECIGAEILRPAELYSYQLESVHTVPGFTAVPLTIVALISEIGTDMSVFPSVKYLTSRARCYPRNDQSNKKVESTRISRTGCYLKPLLVQVASAVIKSDRYPGCRERYHGIRARRGHKKTIITAYRMSLTTIWNVLPKLEPYSAKGHLTNKLMEHPTVISRTGGLVLLRKRGYALRDELAVESG